MQEAARTLSTGHSLNFNGKKIELIQFPQRGTKDGTALPPTLTMDATQIDSLRSTMNSMTLLKAADLDS